MTPYITIKNVSKSFGDKKILNDISLEFNKGEITALIGRSGCGKSTLIKILVGYHPQDSGTILINGKNLEITAVKKMVGYTTQENSFYEKLTIHENMQYYANLYSIKNKEKRISELLKAVSLEDHAKTLAGNISGGMKRRLDFAISLLHSPEFVILDEPTTGLDPILVEQFWKIVTAIVKEQNIAVLVTTHILSEVKRYCDNAAIMHKGTIAKRLAKTNDIEKEFEKWTK